MQLALTVVLAVLAVTAVLGAAGYLINRSWERHHDGHTDDSSARLR